MSALKRHINAEATGKRAVKTAKRDTGSMGHVTESAAEDATILRDAYLRVFARGFCGHRLQVLKAMEMLMEGSTQADAARAVGLPKSNVRYWWNRLVKRFKESATRSE